MSQRLRTEQHAPSCPNTIGVGEGGGVGLGGLELSGLSSKRPTPMVHQPAEPRGMAISWHWKGMGGGGGEKVPLPH